ncbi:MAG: hypothetical protein EBX17_01920, partial [Betaproteobacteria bacterium]|nr:hypothetical protein [Betaproteobacteria bacterium]
RASASRTSSAGAIHGHIEPADQLVHIVNRQNTGRIERAVIAYRERRQGGKQIDAEGCVGQAGAGLAKADTLEADALKVKARGVRLELPHPVAGSVPQIASPMRFSETALDHQRPPPMLGEHSDAILASLGLSPAQIAELRAQAVI